MHNHTTVRFLVRRKEVCWHYLLLQFPCCLGDYLHVSKFDLLSSSERKASQSEGSYISAVAYDSVNGPFLVATLVSS